MGLLSHKSPRFIGVYSHVCVQLFVKRHCDFPSINWGHFQLSYFTHPEWFLYFTVCFKEERRPLGSTPTLPQIQQQEDFPVSIPEGSTKANAKSRWRPGIWRIRINYITISILPSGFWWDLLVHTIMGWTCSDFNHGPLGRSDISCFPSTDYRTYGVPTLRTDLPAPRIKRIEDRKNYGDESDAYGLTNPSIFSRHGVFERDFLRSRTKEEVNKCSLLTSGQIHEGCLRFRCV
jgi:hypothetical protein